MFLLRPVHMCFLNDRMTITPTVVFNNALFMSISFQQILCGGEALLGTWHSERIKIQSWPSRNLKASVKPCSAQDCFFSCVWSSHQLLLPTDILSAPSDSQNGHQVGTMSGLSCFPRSIMAFPKVKWRKDLTSTRALMPRVGKSNLNQSWLAGSRTHSAIFNRAVSLQPDSPSLLENW